MKSQLSPEQLDQLLPVLASVARLVAGGKSTSDEQLARLLDAAELSDSSDALAELQRWARLLNDVHADPSEDTRQTVIESLMLRGLSEAPVVLAVAQAAGVRVPNAGEARHLRQAPPREPVYPVAKMPDSGSSELRISEDTLDFGVLAHDAVHSRTLRVEGASGRVTVDNDRLMVVPDTFSSAPTSIVVTLRPGAAGVMLATLQFETDAGMHSVPVTAQVESVPYIEPAEPPVSLSTPQTTSSGRTPALSKSSGSPSIQPVQSGSKVSRPMPTGKSPIVQQVMQPQVPLKVYPPVVTSPPPQPVLRWILIGGAGIALLLFIVSNLSAPPIPPVVNPPIVETTSWEVSTGSTFRCSTNLPKNSTVRLTLDKGGSCAEGTGFVVRLDPSNEQLVAKPGSSNCTEEAEFSTRKGGKALVIVVTDVESNYTLSSDDITLECP